MAKITAPYGSWKSPVKAELLATAGIGIGDAAPYAGGICWLERRPLESGRNVLVVRAADGTTRDLTPAGFNVRTTVHEYGGASFVVWAGTIYFSNFSDQRLFVQRPGAAPEPFSPALELRYGDALIDPLRERLICVREEHRQAGHEAVNTLVSIDLHTGGAGEVLVSGSDFVTSPRLHPQGTHLAWLTWNHPNMPWDGTELWVAELDADGTPRAAQRVAGGLQESVFQPEWAADGSLYFVSDRTGWWNLYRWTGSRVEDVCPQGAEFGVPQWGLGMSTYGLIDAETALCAYTQHGRWHLARVALADGDLREIELPFADISFVRVAGTQAVFLAGSATMAQSVILLDLASGSWQVVARSSAVEVDSAYLSIPEAVEFPTTDGQTAHALFYRPRNCDYQAPVGDLPPLLVRSHGGPTAAASGNLDWGLQYWTSRGFAVVDVNYGGSTGYGRAYRQRLQGNWGVVDVDDCVHAAQHLVAQGLVDGQRLAIRGGSAGGYTTLAALTFRDVFRAGASYYGIGDLEALARDTHKFESRYLDGLVGPYPASRELYRQRSPIHFVDRLNCPLILFQGLEDRVVPPDQAETMFEAVRRKGIPVAYVPFAGEQHGFRRAENIQRALEAELFFYSRVFGFSLSDAIEPVPIANL